MRRTGMFFTLFLVLLCATDLQSQTGARKLTNQDVVDLVTVGLSANVIIDKIHAAEAIDFDISVEALKSLKTANVPDEVIRAMINAHPSAASVSPEPGASSASSSVSDGAKEATSNTAADDQHSLKMAEGYMEESRWEDAITAFQAAYETNPKAEILAQMGIAYLAAGRGTEAEDVFDKVLAQGGEIHLFVKHYHAWDAPCFGSLVIRREHLIWLSNQVQKENFQANWSDVQKIENFESSLSADYRQQYGKGMPEFRIRVKDKNWRFMYLLSRHFTLFSGNIVYSGIDLKNADKANAIILSLLNKARSMPPLTPKAQPQSAVPAVKDVPRVLAASPNGAATIPMGNQLVVRLVDPLDSEQKDIFSNPFRGVLDEAISIQGQQIIPKGAEVRGKVVSYRHAGRSAEVAEILMRLQDIALGQTKYPLSTESFTQQAAEWGKPAHLEPGALISFRLNQALTLAP